MFQSVFHHGENPLRYSVAPPENPLRSTTSNSLFIAVQERGFFVAACGALCGYGSEIRLLDLIACLQVHAFRNRDEVQQHRLCGCAEPRCSRAVGLAVPLEVHERGRAGAGGEDCAGSCFSRSQQRAGEGDCCAGQSGGGPEVHLDAAEAPDLGLGPRLAGTTDQGFSNC